MENHKIDRAKALSTGIVANILGISLQSVIRMIDDPNYKGLQGLRKPGSKIRRIPLRSLLNFISDKPALEKRFLYYLEVKDDASDNALDDELDDSLSPQDCGIDGLVGTKGLRFQVRAHLYTTGEAKIIFQCSIQSVIRIYDRGKLAGFKIPPLCKERRIEADSLARILEQSGIPVQSELVSNSSYFLDYPGKWEQKDLVLLMPSRESIWYRENDLSNLREASLRFENGSEGIYIRQDGNVHLILTGRKYITGQVIPRDEHLNAIMRNLNHGRDIFKAMPDSNSKLSVQKTLDLIEYSQEKIAKQ